MIIVPSGIDAIFEVTYPTGLYVGMIVYDETVAGAPALIGTVPMVERKDGMYVGRYQGAEGHSYSLKKAVFEDSELTTIDDTYPGGSETFYVSTQVDLTSTLEILQALALGFAGAGATDLDAIDCPGVVLEAVVDEEIFNG